MPVRVQRRRTKGYKLPPNTVCVTRGTKWGNPFPIGKEGPLGRTAPDAEGAVGFFREIFRDPEMRAAAGYPEDLTPLRGKNLACWCGESDKWCHADVLLALANDENPRPA